MEEMKNLVSEETLVDEGVELVEVINDNSNLQKGLAIAAGVALVGATIFVTKKVISKTGVKPFSKFRKNKDDEVIDDAEFEEVDETDEVDSDEE